MRAKSLLWSLAMLTVLVVSVPTMAQDASEAPQNTESQSQNGDQNARPTASVAVTGGAVKKVLAKTNVDADFQSNNTTSFVAVTGAQRVVNVPLDGDMFLITFSARCRLYAGTTAFDRVEVEIRDGSTSLGTFHFCSDLNWSSNSVQIAKTLSSQGNHTIKVYFRTTDTDKVAYLGDWTLSILQAD